MLCGYKSLIKKCVALKDPDKPLAAIISCPNCIVLTSGVRGLESDRWDRGRGWHVQYQSEMSIRTAILAHEMRREPISGLVEQTKDVNRRFGGSKTTNIICPNIIRPT